MKNAFFFSMETERITECGLNKRKIDGRIGKVQKMERLLSKKEKSHDSQRDRTGISGCDG